MYQRSLIIVVCLVALAGLSSAQNLIAYDPIPDVMEESCVLGPASPWASSRAGIFPVGMRAPLGVLEGGCVVDSQAGVIWYTNGTPLIGALRYPGVRCAGAALPAPPPPISLAGVIPVIHGLAHDAAAGILYATDGGAIAACTVPAGAVTLPLTPIAGLPGILTGLFFDPFTNQLKGVTAAGDVIFIDLATYTVVGILPWAWGLPAAGASATGVALDRSCFMGISSYVAWSDGSVMRFSDGALLPTTLANPRGLSFIASPQVLPSPSCAALPFELTVNQLAVSGVPGLRLFLCGVPAGTPATLFLSLGVIPGGVGLGASGTLWLNLATAFAVPIAPLPSGALAIAPLPGLPLCLQFYAQAVIVCPATGMPVLSNALQVTVSAP